jgi:hypothetical protein
MTKPHILLLGDCLLQPPPVDPFFSGVTRYWEETIKMFLSTHDPSHLMQFHWHFDFVTPPITDSGGITIPLQCTLISTIDAPHCLSSKFTESTVIIDMGASVCISPHQTDFVTYGDSAMKIKDLSSSNQVVGEGLIRWSLCDATGAVVDIELMGYHIPTADVRLLSPQVLLWSFGGHALLNSSGMDICLDDGVNLSANYCPRTNLPMIPLALSPGSQYCFWSDAFGYTTQDYKESVGLKSVLHQTNSNLSSSQKEVLLWHQRLSHASINWIQTLMHDRKWLPNSGNLDTALHSGPFIFTKVVLLRVMF